MNEGKNIEKVGEMFKKYKYIRVPKVYWKYCSDRVLTMEYCRGSRIDNIKLIKSNGINPKKVNSQNISKLF